MYNIIINDAERCSGNLCFTQCDIYRATWDWCLNYLAISNNLSNYRSLLFHMMLVNGSATYVFRYWVHFVQKLIIIENLPSSTKRMWTSFQWNTMQEGSREWNIKRPELLHGAVPEEVISLWAQTRDFPRFSILMVSSRSSSRKLGITLHLVPWPTWWFI